MAQLVVRNLEDSVKERLQRRARRNRRSMEEEIRETAGLMAQRQKRGRPGELRDTMIAGIVLAHRASLATGNTAHLSDLATPAYQSVDCMSRN